MAELGYQQGRNFSFEYIQAPSIEGYDLIYRELAARKVDILLAAGNEPALRAAHAAGGATPIVFIAALPGDTYCAEVPAAAHDAPS